MSAAKSEFTADLLINVLKNEPELPLYLGFCVSEVTGEKDPQVRTYEVTDPAYRRQLVRLTNPQKMFVGLQQDLQFPRASKQWNRVTHFAIFDAEKDGNMILLKPTGGITSVEAGEIVMILAAEFLLYLGQNTVSQGDFE